MKFLLPIAVFAIAGVSAQDKKCLANYIVDRCLSTETEKVHLTYTMPTIFTPLTHQGLRL